MRILTGSLTHLLVLCFVLMIAERAHATDVPASFSLDGELFSDAAGTTPLLDASIGLKIQILDNDLLCVLYEENQSINTVFTKGYFSVQVGTPLADAKRTGTDSANTMPTVFQNMAGVTGKKVSDGTACTATAVGGRRRYVRMIISPATMGGTPRVLTPDLPIDSVPNAIVADRAESLQGFRGADFLKVNTAAGAALSQTNIESLFSSAGRFNSLTAVVDGTSTNYMRTTTAGAVLPTYNGAPAAPAQGSVWFDTSDQKMKYRTSTTTEILGTSSGAWTASGSDVYRASGKVGIGTATPLASVDVVDGEIGLRSGTQKPRMTLWAQNSNTFQGQIDFVGSRTNGTAYPAVNDVLGIINFGNLQNSSARIYGVSSEAQSVTAGGGFLAFHTTPVTTNLTSERMRIDQNGFVGIGTTVPAYPFHVHTPSAGYAEVALTNTVTGEASGDGLSIGVSPTQSAYIFNQEAHELAFGTSDTARMTILADGKIGIGTPTPSTLLDLNGASTFRATTAPAAVAAQGKIYFDSGTNKFKVSENGGGFVDLVGGGGGGSGTVTSVSSANAYLSVATGTTTPALTLNVGTAADTVAAGNDSRITGALQAATAFVGDVSGVYSATSVDKIKGTGVAITSITSGNFLKYNGTNWINSMLAAGDVTTALTYTPVNKAGDTMTGLLVLSADPSNVLGASTKQYVDSSTSTAAANYVRKDATVALTADWDIDGAGAGTRLLTGLAAPTVGDGAATKTYADTKFMTMNLPAAPAAGQNGQSLRWNNATPAWEFYTPGGGGGGSGDFLADGTVPMTGALRMGGQTINGNSTASGNLTLDSTSNATKGYVLLAPTGGNVGVGIAAPTSRLHVSGGSLVVDSVSNTVAYVNFGAGNVQMSSTAATAINICGLKDGGTYTLVLTGVAANTTVTVNAYPTYASTSSCTGTQMQVDLGGGDVTFLTAGNTNILSFVYFSARGANGTVYGMPATNFNY